jgi:hypothetical protein
MLITVKKVGERTFQFRNAVWTESDPAVTGEPDRTIEFLSDEYFDFVQKNPAAKVILALGENILFRWNGRLIRIHQS